MSTKKAVIVVELGYESTQASNTQIEREIKREAQIPWCKKIRRIDVYSSQ